MPFTGSFRHVYKHVISRAVEAAGMICERGDDSALPGTIVSQIWNSILRSQVVIADVTGSNGDVLYELGLAHAVGREAILLTQRIEDIPFDLRQQRHILYSYSDLTNLAAKLEQAVRAAKVG